MDAMKRMVLVTGLIGVVLAVVLAVTIDRVFAEEETPATAATKHVVTPIEYLSLAISAALAAGFGFLGGGYAVAQVGAAALGAASERPEMLVRSLVFVALGEGIAIFGMVIAIMMILRLPA